MTNEPTPFSSLLRSLRAKSGLSLSAAARNMGISKAHLHELESGRAVNPTVGTLAVLAETYGSSPSTLLKAAIFQEATR